MCLIIKITVFVFRKVTVVTF